MTLAAMVVGIALLPKKQEPKEEPKKRVDPMWGDWTDEEFVQWGNPNLTNEDIARLTNNGRRPMNMHPYLHPIAMKTRMDTEEKNLRAAWDPTV